MIPQKIHYCWFGHGEMPQLAKDCIATWHKYMPDWEYKLWDEGNFDVMTVPYTKEAYEAKKFAFVSDYVRLWALYNEGGLYLDVDFEVYKPFDDLLSFKAFAGVEGSKYNPIMMGVCASEAHGVWIGEMLDAYKDRHFIVDGKFDLTPNVTYLTFIMHRNGLIQNGLEQDYKDLHIFPVDYFSPRLTTGDYNCTVNTYCEHKGLSSWAGRKRGWKNLVLFVFGEKNRSIIIKLKRKLFG